MMTGRFRGLLILLLPGACVPREARPPAPSAIASEGPAAAEAVLLPGDLGTLPPETLARLPPLPPTRAGMAAGEELGAVLRERAVFKIEADLGVLDGIDDEAAARLRSELAADPRWRLTRWEGQPVAFQRQRQGNGWSIGWGGLQRGPDEALRVVLHLGTTPAWEGAVRVNAPTHRPLVVDSWPVRGGPFAGMQAALLVVKGPRLSLEVQELARDLQLSHTAAALMELPVRLEEVTRGIPLRRAAPTGEVALLAEPMEDGSLDLRGWLNPGEPGLCWLRIVGPAGRPWQEPLVLAATLEEIGHSADPAQRFYLQGVLPLVEPLPEAARLQAWFQPEVGGPARMLAEVGL